VPYIEINSNSILENLERVREVCRKQSVALTVVTKFFTSDTALVRLLYENGVDSIADTNIENFAQKGLPPLKKTLIKTSLSGIRSLSGLAPASRPQRLFISDEALLEAAGDFVEEAEDGAVETVLVAEAGDLRDGFYMEDIPAVAARYGKARIAGVAANFGCLSGKMPDVPVIRRLFESAAAIPPVGASTVPPIVSIGGTVAYNLLASGALSGMVTELRMGEGIFFGWDSSSSAPLEGFKRDAFTLYGEIVEIREKTVEPVEGAGYTAFGGEAAPRKRGRRLCAVLDFGLLGGSMYDLEPLDRNVEAAGQTYDFTVLDITESAEGYKTGGFVPFRAMYAASARAFLNPYIKRVLK
jgi:predicted amino acid racemase